MLRVVRVPHGLMVFVTALAIFDDIGGILVIALFYGGAVDGRWLWGAAALVLVLAWMGRSGVRHGAARVFVGALLWLALHHGGVRATIAGVLVGLAVPARVATKPRVALQALAVHLASLGESPIDEAVDGQDLLSVERALEAVQAPLDRLLHLLHPWVALGIMPAFALVNR